MELELELARAERLRRLADLVDLQGLPGAPVPDDHVTPAVLALGDHALEVVVLDRVILGPGRHPPLQRLERRAARDRPADQHAIDLEPEVVVETRRAVALDHEPGLAGSRSGRGARGLGRLAEVPLSLVGVERHAPLSVPGRDYPSERPALASRCGVRCRTAGSPPRPAPDRW